MIRVCHYSGLVPVRDRLALSQRRLLDVSAVLRRSPQRSTLDISRAMWTVNMSLRYSQSMALWSPWRCRRMATIPSSLADMLTSALSRPTMPRKQYCTWMAVGRLFCERWNVNSCRHWCIKWPCLYRKMALFLGMINHAVSGYCIFDLRIVEYLIPN